MSKIKFVTDSASDISPELAEELDIDIIPFSIEIDGAIYKENIDFTPREFYKLMENAKSIPTTAQIPTFSYLQVFERYYQQGYDMLMLVSLASTASSTFERAVEAREMFYNEHPEAIKVYDIRVIDSKTFSIAYGYPVLESARMHRNGATLSDILYFLDDWFNSFECYFTAFSYKYIRQSGRISTGKALVGELISIRPILNIIDGTFNVIKKVHGDNAVLKAFSALAAQRIREGHVYGILAGTYQGISEKLERLLTAQLGRKPFAVFDVGSAIAINSGPDMLGFGFLGEYRRRERHPEDLGKYHK